MPDSPNQSMPTGISSLDPVWEGGVPPGSILLLLGDIGAGSMEFIYSSILSLALQNSGGTSGSPALPEEICYITFTRSKEDVIGEMNRSFHPDMTRELSKIRYKDLSQIYFDTSVIPLEWYSKKDLRSRMQSRADHGNILANLAEELNSVKKNSLIVLDSLTDLATQFDNARWNEFAAFLKGLQRVSKQWNSTIYLPLTRGILDPSREQEMADTADAVLLFRWEETSGARRQRVMYTEKFRGLMPHLEEKDLVKFAVRISSAGGFEVSNIRVVI